MLISVVPGTLPETPFFKIEKIWLNNYFSKEHIQNGYVSFMWSFICTMINLFRNTLIVWFKYCNKLIKWIKKEDVAMLWI